jgi:hypothetical protein
MSHIYRLDILNDGLIGRILTQTIRKNHKIYKARINYRD